MSSERATIYMWHNNMCITYTLTFKRFEDFFLANDWRLAERPEQADWILVGACAGFFSQIEDYLKQMKTFSNTGAKLAVFGCLPKVAPEQFAASAAKVDVYIRPESPEQVQRIVPSPAVRWRDVPDPTRFRRQDYRKYDLGKRFIVVQYGCDAGCVYCPHRIGMGPQVSRPREEILKLARQLIAGGSSTLFLEGMDSGSWGTDLRPAGTYLDVLEPILAMAGNFHVHIGRLGANWCLHYGDGLPDALSHPRVTDIKIPIQAVSPRLLELMGRDPRVLELGPFLDALRRRKKILNLRTDLIVGFPTEADEELDSAVRFSREHFDEVAVFGFEVHPNTPVAEMNLPFYQPDIIESRVQRALAILSKSPQIITHRGEQVRNTLVESEKRRTELGLA